MGNRERKNEIKVRLSDDELRLLHAKMKAVNARSREWFLRHLIVYGFVYEVDYSEIRKCNEHLGRIGNNINQIAHKMNETGQVFAEDVGKIKEAMREIWRLQESILSQQP